MRRLFLPFRALTHPIDTAESADVPGGTLTVRSGPEGAVHSGGPWPVKFTVLLTGQILVPPVPVAGAASGYLVYTKRDLHYTIHYRGIPRPISIRFTNEEGNILEEHEIPPAPHHSQGSKVCGVWRKLPKVYRRLLQKDKLIFVLATAEHPEGIVGGRVLKHNAINT
ncbi:hypothetical protein AVEN_182768-1, partial [Araneus ventricosus]